MTLPCSSLCCRILQIKPKLPREHAFVSMKEASGICFSTTLTSWCLSPQLPGWILEGFFYLNKQTALNEDYQDYYYHDHVVVIALTLQRKHTRWTRRRWVCHPLTSVTICRYRKYLIFLVKKSPFSAKAVIVYTGYFFMCRFLLVIKQTNTVRVSKIKLQHARVEVFCVCRNSFFLNSYSESNW